MRSDKSGSFEDGLEEADCHYVSRMMCASRGHGKACPHNLSVISSSPFKELMASTYHTSRKEYSWFKIIQCDVARYLANCVADGEDSVDLVELIATKG